jgi:AraC-like DNA-binding protein
MSLGIQATVSNWLAKMKKYLFTYSDGFYELPYIANSPELMLASFSYMPFTKHDVKRKSFTTNNVFIKGAGHYQKLEEGLWVILSDFEVKRNVSFKLHYEPGIEVKHHSLSLYINKDTRLVKFPKINYDVESQDRSWFLVKAGARALNSHFKGQKSIFINIYFTDEWMQQNIATNGVMQNPILADFFSASSECLFLPKFLESKKDVYLKLVNSILEKDENGVSDLLLQKSRTLELLSAFVNELGRGALKPTTMALPERDMRRVVKAEHLLNEAVFKEFPSIVYLANQVGISETKLKADFKSTYGCTLYRYFVSKQMTYAKELIQSQQLPIKEVALKFGYTHPGKFSEAYKKIYGHSPSRLID